MEVVPSGELDIATAGRLREVLRSQEDPARIIVLDLRRLEFIDMSGLRLVSDEHERARRRGFDLRVVAGDEVRRLISLTGAPQAFPWAT